MPSVDISVPMIAKKIKTVPKNGKTLVKNDFHLII